MTILSAVEQIMWNFLSVLDEELNAMKEYLDAAQSFEIKNFRRSCFIKKIPERSPEEFLEAAKLGKVSVVSKILKERPEYIRQVTFSNETALHLAVRNGHSKVVKVLMEHLMGSFYYNEIIDTQDSGGDTVLHLAVARKQLLTVQLLLEHDPASAYLVNARNIGGFTALDILDVVPEGGEADMDIEKALTRAGALRAREVANGNKVESKVIEQKFDKKRQEVRIEFDDSSRRTLHSTMSDSLRSWYFGVLITATLLATMTYHASLRQSSLLTVEVMDTDNVSKFKERDAVISHLFILFNSMTFFTSVALITILTHELPIKPWLHISVFSAAGAYMCSVMAISPHETVTVFFIGFSVFLASLLRGLALHKKIFHNMQCMRARIHLI